MGLPLPRPCIVCQRLTRPGEPRCQAHAITRSPSLRRLARASTPPGTRTPCASCAKPLPPREIEWDHRIPLWAGGLDTFSNLQALCEACHARKTLSDLREHRPG